MNNITGSQYTLKPMTENSITKEYIDWLNNPKVNKFLEVRHVMQNYRTVSEYINSFYQEEEKYFFGIYDMDKLIGTTNLTNVDRSNHSAEIGLVIGDMDYWGKSASTEAFNLVLNFAFNTLNMKRVTGGCYDTNIGIIFTFKMIGFVRENVRNIYNNKPAHQWAINKKQWLEKFQDVKC
jgi:RimJ/RimL family protein N-acetyltransferase